MDFPVSSFPLTLYHGRKWITGSNSSTSLPLTQSISGYSPLLHTITIVVISYPSSCSCFRSNILQPRRTFASENRQHKRHLFRAGRPGESSWLAYHPVKPL